MRVTQLNATTQPWFEKLDKFTLLTNNLEAWNLKNLYKHAISKFLRSRLHFIRRTVRPLTDKEALTVLCSVVKHAGLAAARTRKKCRGQHEM